MTKCLTYVSKPLALGELNAEILQLGLALSLDSTSLFSVRVRGNK
jgi:hypothetical protein